MSVSLHIATEYMRVFKGYEGAYGQTVVYDEVDKETKKRKSKSWTEPNKISEEAYQAHFNGKTGLGIIPINENGACSFSVIDIDKYADNTAVIATVRKHDFPVVPFRSKSGGLHLYMFYKEPMPAKTCIMWMKRIRMILGLDNKTEIFPKQSMRASNEMTGSWINLPYFDVDNTTRWAYGKDNKPMDIAVALAECNKKMATEESLKAWYENLPLHDAPPCLQSIYLSGTTEYRNLYLFSLARYYKAALGEDYKGVLEEANSILSKPLAATEIDAIYHSHEKKEYGYKCDEDPIKPLCAKQECVERAFGIHSDAISGLVFEEMIQWRTDPPYYEWKVNGHLLRFNDESEIVSQIEFIKLCIRELHIFPRRLKDEKWREIVGTALSNIEVKEIDVADDISPGALFMSLLTEFLTRRAMADTREQLLVDKVYFDPEKKCYVFKAKNLVEFLLRNQFRYFGQTEIHSRLKKLGGFSERYYVNNKNKGLRVWLLPKDALTKFIEVAQDEVAIDFGQKFSDEPF